MALSVEHVAQVATIVVSQTDNLSRLFNKYRSDYVYIPTFKGR